MKTVFVDVDTQLDFLYPAGALYVPGAEHIVPAVERLNRYAAAHRIPVLSTADAHAENDPEFGQWPPHCVAGTTGQHKAAATLLDKPVTVPNCDCELSLEGAQQVIVEKQSVDVFTARNLERILRMLDADRFVVYGVVTEICVRSAARGLLAAGKPVVLVADAVKELRADEAARTMDELRSRGVTISSVAEICAD
ncbi:MAG TPA: isochorismatase family cysteine hydrolase [Bryobacteraceae bacterium]